MKVRYKLYVPVWVEVDLRDSEVTSVNVMDDSPVGKDGWRHVRGRVEFETPNASFTDHSRHVDHLTGGERAALDKALDIADDAVWPSWEWGW